MNSGSFINNANLIFKANKKSSFSFCLIFALILILFYSLASLAQFIYNTRYNEIRDLKANFIIKENAKYEEIDQFAKVLKANYYISTVDSITPQAALESYMKRFGTLDSSLLPINPMPYVLTCSFDPSKFDYEQIKNDIYFAKNNSIVQDLVFAEEKAKTIDKISDRSVAFLAVFSVGFIILFSALISSKYSYLLNIYFFNGILQTQKYWKSFSVLLWLSLYFLLISSVLVVLAVYSLIASDILILPNDILLSTFSICTPIISAIIIILYSSLKVAYQWSKLATTTNIDVPKVEINKVNGFYIP